MIKNKYHLKAMRCDTLRETVRNNDGKPQLPTRQLSLRECAWAEETEQIEKLRCLQRVALGRNENIQGSFSAARVERQRIGFT